MVGNNKEEEKEEMGGVRRYNSEEQEGRTF